MNKEFGKLTLEQFKTIVKDLPEVRANMDELPRLIRSADKEKLEALLGSDFVWSSWYELPFINCLAFLVVGMGKAADVVAYANADDPQQAMLDDQNWPDADEWQSPFGGVFTKATLIGLFVVLQRNIQSFMLHHRSINALVDEVRTAQDWQVPFFHAVRIDRSVLTCPTFAVRLSRAELEQDNAFFLHLRSAVKGHSKKYWQSLHDLRFVFVMLREMGCHRLSDKEMERLLVHELQLYPNTPTALRNLRKQFRESRNFSTT